MSNSGMSVCLNEERFRCNTRSGDPVKVTSRSCMGNGWAQVRITVQLDIKSFGKRRPLLEKGK